MIKVHLATTMSTTGEIKQALLECFKNPDILAAIKEQIIIPAIKEAVQEATSAKEEELIQLRTEVRDLSDKINDLEQYNRRNNLCITGIAEEPGENCKQIIQTIGKKLNIEVSNEDVRAAYRLGKKEQKTRPLLVEFSFINKRNEIFNARKHLREKCRNVYINEHLTQKNYNLLYKMRKMKKEKKIFSVWTVNGKIRVRSSEGSQPNYVTSIGDVGNETKPKSSMNYETIITRHGKRAQIPQ